MFNDVNCCYTPQVFVGLHLLVTRQDGVLFLKDEGVLVQEIASVRVSQRLAYAAACVAVMLALLLPLLVVSSLLYVCCLKWLCYNAVFCWWCFLAVAQRVLSLWRWSHFYTYISILLYVNSGLKPYCMQAASTQRSTENSQITLLLSMLGERCWATHQDGMFGCLKF